jgi:hypothetical protein
VSLGLRLAAFAVVLGMAVGAGAVVGAAIGPTPPRDAPMDMSTHTGG